MGVDFYPCAWCETVYCDCGDYYTCEKCGLSFCSKECAALQYVDDVSSCRYCRLENVIDHELMQFLLAKLGLTRQLAEELYRKEKRDDSLNG